MAIFKSNNLPSRPPPSLRVRQTTLDVHDLSAKPKALSMLAQPMPFSLGARLFRSSTTRDFSQSPAQFQGELADFPLTTSPDASCQPESPTVDLLPLSFAHTRKDIRWRKEGFEMASTDSDAIPFALRTHTLVPLDIAYARDDIRRRDEAFALRAATIDMAVEVDVSLVSASVTCSSTLSPRSTMSASIVFSATLSPRSSISCMLSTHASRGQLSVGDPSEDLDDAVLAVYDVYQAFSLYELGYGTASDESVADSLSTGPSSFDEASFIRMAEESLGW